MGGVEHLLLPKIPSFKILPSTPSLLALWFKNNDI